MAGRALSRMVFPPRRRSQDDESRAHPRIARGWRAVLAAAPALLLSGCDWTVFDGYRETAPIRAYDAPENYRKPRFGAVVESFHGRVKGSQVSRIIASAGLDSPIIIRRAWNGEHIGGDALTRCKGGRDCQPDLGGVLVPFEAWAYGTPQQQEGCVLALGLPNAYVFCETNTRGDANFPLNLDGQKPAAGEIRLSGAGLPAEHPLGIALIGAYAQVDGEPQAGRLYFQPDFRPEEETGGKVRPLEPLPLIDPSTGDAFSEDPRAGDLGYAVVTRKASDNRWIIAVSQPARERVIIASFDEERAGAAPEAQTWTHACIAAPAGAPEGFGKRLALGDVRGDGALDVFVGHDPLGEGAAAQERLWMYPGAGLPDALAPDGEQAPCPSWGEPPVEITCSELTPEVPCEGSAFGAAFAAGDVNGDGSDDLIVGAPRAEVRGVAEAGALWVFPGGHDQTSGLDLEAAVQLTVPPQRKGHLGAQVAALRTRGRDEPVAGAPGEDRVYLFMCSGLEGENIDALCLPGPSP